MSKIILTFVKNSQGQILIDQNRSEILEESMRCSFLVKFEGLRLQFITSLLLSWYYSSIFCTSFLRNTYSGKHFLVAVQFYINCETRKLARKPLKNKTNFKKVKFTVLLQIIYQGVLETRRDRPREHKCDVPVLFLCLFQKYLFQKIRT